MELLAIPFIGLFLIALFTLEVIGPASKNQCNKRWLVMSTVLGTLSLITMLVVGFIFQKTVQSIAIFKTQDVLPDALVGLLSFLLTTFTFYWWHRLSHQSDWVWRVFHQLHHSARRIESLTAFYAHPLDTAAAVILSGLSSYVVFGASPLAAAVALLLTGMFDLFCHADIRTPTWMGYIVQRPEQHTVHHAYEHHAQNYGLPIWDLMFGTWTNPKERHPECGFDEERSARIHDMLTFQDVHQKP